MSKGKSASRRGERAQAFQVLYGLSFADATSLEDVRRAFLQSPDHQETEEGELPSGFAWDLVQGVWSRRDELDKTISRFSRNWRVDRMGRVELTLLRLAMYELLYRQDVPAKVAINEALELTRQFGEDNATSFVNGILDAAAKALEKGFPLRRRGFHQLKADKCHDARSLFPAGHRTEMAGALAAAGCLCLRPSQRQTQVLRAGDVPLPLGQHPHGPCAQLFHR